MVTTIAIDWSGAVNPNGKIWLARAHDGRLAELKPARTRECAIDWLLKRLEEYPNAIAGLDFAFSMPQWFVEKHGTFSAVDFWEVVEECGERWLRECSPPFWGRPGTTKPNPEKCKLFRRTEEEGADAGTNPKSVFQIGGAGHVGTGSIRGMPFLTKIRDAGLRVWPFDRSTALPMVVEIYPRLLTGPVTKSRCSERLRYLHENVEDLSRDHCDAVMDSEDAFDAAISAIKLTESIKWTDGGWLRDPPARHQARFIEGEIWRNRTGAN